MRIKGLPVVRSGASFRADIDEGGTGDLGEMFVRFSPFNTWYEINSYFEGRFLERTAPGAFKKTAAESKRSDGRYGIKSLFNHGMDPQIADKVMGVPSRFDEVNEDGYHGPELVVPLLRTSYNLDLLPGLQANAYGSSFMFETIRETWVHEPEASDYNPEGLPERTIQEVRAFEAGPVTWPASPTATSGMRSGSDPYVERMAARSPDRHAAMVQSLRGFRAMHNTPEAVFAPTPVSSDETRRQAEIDRTKRDITLRRARLALMRG